MSLETVVEDIREEARERAAEIRADGEDRADEIVAEAEADAEEIHAEAEREAERRIEQRREQALSSATLEAKQERLEARREVLAEVREAVEEAIAGLEGERRAELTRALLDDAADEFDGADDVAVYARADDADLVGSILDEPAYEGFEYAGEYDCLGGVVVDSRSSRVRVNNTFDATLETVWEDSLKELSDRLFEHER